MNRMNIDWSGHELIIEEYPTHTIHWLKRPNTILENVKFTNIHGQLLVTGDYSDWIFCRSFIPSANGCVSDHYWCEKLTLANHNIRYKDFDTDETRKLILDEMENVAENYYIEEKYIPRLKEIIETYFCYSDINDILNQEKFEIKKGLLEELEYYCRCYISAEDKYDYIQEMRDAPSWFDCECYIIGELINSQLKCVFDAFDEICRRLKEKE